MPPRRKVAKFRVCAGNLPAFQLAQDSSTVTQTKIVKPSTSHRLPKLPSFLDRKIDKTGQTRGADDDEIFQNRVSRYSTVLISLTHWELCRPSGDGSDDYGNGYIVLVDPKWHFGTAIGEAELAARGPELGKNALVFYETRTRSLAGIRRPASSLVSEGSAPSRCRK